MKRALLISILIVIGITLIPYNSVLAVAEPDHGFVILELRGFQSVLEGGDQFHLVYFKLNYSTNPTGYVGSDLFMVRLMDGATELYSTPIYTYYDSGFDYGVIGMYFTAAEVAALGMSFGAAAGYSMRLEGNPTITWDGGTQPSYVLNTWNQWYTGTEAQTVLTIRMRFLSQLVENRWDRQVDLVEGLAGETVLTYYGEEYFTNAIPDLLQLCPDMFSAVRDVPYVDLHEDVSDAYVAGDDDTSLSIHGNTLAAQTFTARNAYTTTGIDLELSRTGAPPASLRVRLCSTAGNLPLYSAVLCSGTISVTSVSDYANGEWVSCSFVDGAQLDINQRYAIVLHTPGGDASNCYNWRAIDDGEYTYGRAATSVDGGTNWIANNNDQMFIMTGRDIQSYSFNERMAHRLDGTIWDCGDAADTLGLTVMWLRGTVWFVLSIVACIGISRQSLTYQDMIFVFLFMTSVGAVIGFYYWYLGVFALFVASVAAIYSLTWEKS